jgi:dihydrodipicolinate synthase/N-acetylneuraminate lyase
MTRLRGAIAAAVTPMLGDGRAIDLASIGPLTAFLAAGGVDGVLACGTTGEGVLLRVEERMEVARAFVEAAPEGFLVAVHAGAQTTRDTVTLASHARDLGTDAVAVIAPPYFPLDGDEVFMHLLAAAGACDPLPFYVYEFAARSGYAIPIPVIERLRNDAPNLVGMKVSDSPFEAVEPYLLDGLDVFIGNEPLALQGLGAGAAGSVSGLASAWPSTVASLVHDRDPSAHHRVTALRDRLAGMPFVPAIKHVLATAGVIATADVRRPMRRLTDDERGRVRALG